MSQAYTPGLLVTPQTWWQSRRVLPVSGQILVQRGDVVQAEQVVAETELPGDAFPVNVAKLLGIAAAQVPGTLKIPLGQQVTEGQTLAISSGLFGWFRRELPSPFTGIVEAASAITGQVILRGAPRKVQVKAYLAGEVTELIGDEGVVVEAASAVIQGIFGVGGEAFGTIELATERPDEDLTDDRLGAAHSGAIVVGGRRITRAAVDRARELGVAALVAGGIDDQDLREILGYDLGVAVTGMEQLGLTIIITEGFGDISMADRTFQLLRDLQGQPAAVNGTTQIRAGVLRPEILIPLANVAREQVQAESVSGALERGVPIRIIREPYFGQRGVVDELPSAPQRLESESKARVVSVKLSSGVSVMVPRANVERMEGAVP